MKTVSPYLMAILVIVAAPAMESGLAPVRSQPADITVMIDRYQTFLDVGKLAGAMFEAQRIEATIRVRYGRNNPNYGWALGLLGNVYQRQGKYSAAEDLLKRALAIYEQQDLAEANMATTLTALAVVYDDQGRRDEAVALLERALAIYEKVLGSDRPEVANTLSYLGLLHKSQGRYGQAEEFLSRALAIYEQADPTDPDLALTINSLGATYGIQGRYIEAEALFKRALALLEQAFGPNHSYLADITKNLALIYRNQGRYEEAERLLEKAAGDQGKGH